MPRMKVYKGWRDGQHVPHVTVNNHALRYVAYHASEFDWGNDSDGAADLALSILANYFNERPNPQSKRFLSGGYMCWLLHQDFKAEAVAMFSRTERWAVTSEQITLWLERKQSCKPPKE